MIFAFDICGVLTTHKDTTGKTANFEYYSIQNAFNQQFIRSALNFWRRIQLYCITMSHCLDRGGDVTV